MGEDPDAGVYSTSLTSDTREVLVRKYEFHAVGFNYRENHTKHSRDGDSEADSGPAGDGEYVFRGI